MPCFNLAISFKSAPSNSISGLPNFGAGGFISGDSASTFGGALVDAFGAGAGAGVWDGDFKGLITA